jgi:hypothetical protein
MKKTRGFLLTASIVLATTFTLSCSGDGGGDPSSSSGGGTQGGGDPSYASNSGQGALCKALRPEMLTPVSLTRGQPKLGVQTNARYALKGT